MKLATLKDRTRDGQLVVVSRDLTQCVSARPIAATLQAALDDWEHVAPRLEALAFQLELGSVPAERFHEHNAQSPLPRAVPLITSPVDRLKFPVEWLAPRGSRAGCEEGAPSVKAARPL